MVPKKKGKSELDVLLLGKTSFLVIYKLCVCVCVCLCVCIYIYIYIYIYNF